MNDNDEEEHQANRTDAKLYSTNLLTNIQFNIVNQKYNHNLQRIR